MKVSVLRSPLDRAKALRVPGQSLDAEIQDVGYDHILAPMTLVLFMIVMAGWEWYRDYFHVKPSPWTFTGGAVLAIAYAAFRIARVRKRLRQLRLGRDGERAVAQYLEWFRSASFFVFHDVPNGDANIDHLLVGPKGVFTIETKTLSKPSRGDCKIVVKDGVIRANGQALDRDPIAQAKAQANWLRQYLAESKFAVKVQPVVVFPGWFVEPFDMARAGAWVLEIKALEKFVANEPDRLPREQVQAIASAVRSHIRSQLA